MIKKYIDFIKEEIGLTIKDLDKPSDDGLRGDTLIKKIKSGLPLKIENDTEAIIDTDEDGVTKKTIIDNLVDDKSGKYSPDKAKDVFLTDKGRYKEVLKEKEKGGKFRKFKLNQLSKTSEFGSSKGSSAGSTITRDQESIQTILFAYCAQTGYFWDETEDNITEEEILDMKNIILDEIQNKTYSKYYSVEDLGKVNLDNIAQYYNTWKWTTNTFIKSLDNPESYEFHQIGSKSDLITTIKSVYSKCCKKSLPNFKLINISKWNPSDVWVVKKSSINDVITRLREVDCSDVTALSNLHNLVDELFEDNDLFGISLKKISKSDNIKKKIIINGLASRPIYKLKNDNAIDFGINNKTVVLYVDKFLESDDKNIGSEKITISNNSSAYADINIEISSISSRQGKCSLTTINNFLEYKGNYVIEPHSKLLKLSIDDQEDILNSAIDNLGDDLFRKKSMDKNKDLKESDIISRIQAITLCEILYDDIEIGNEILNNILLYALAIEWSFDGDTRACPKYYRIIEYNKQN